MKNNELIKVEENQLIIAQEIISKIKDLEIKRKLIDEKSKEFKDKLNEIMGENDITSWESNDKTLKITRTPETKVFSFDTKKFEKEHTDLFLEYQKETQRKGSVRITIREEK